MMAPIARVLYFRFSRIRLIDAITRILVLFAVVVAAAAVSGQFWFSDEELTTAGCDLSRALAIRNWDSCAEVTSFPLVRDYASLIHVIMIAVMGTYGGVLIDGLAGFWKSAQSTRTLLSPSANELKWIAKIDNPRVVGLYDSAILLLGFLMCYTGALGYSANGIYPSLAMTTDDGEFARQALNASWSAFPLPGWFVFLIVGSIGNYYILQLVVAAIFSLRLGLGAYWRDALRIRSFAADSMWDWSSVFDAVRSGVITSIFGLLGLLALLIRGGYANLPYLLAFPAVALAAVLPWFVVNHIWSRAVESSLRDLGVKIGAAGAALIASEHVAYVSLQLAPTRIVPLVASLLQLAFTVLPGLIAFAQVTGAWK